MCPEWALKVSLPCGSPEDRAEGRVRVFHRNKMQEFDYKHTYTHTIYIGLGAIMEKKPQSYPVFQRKISYIIIKNLLGNLVTISSQSRVCCSCKKVQY